MPSRVSSKQNAVQLLIISVDSTRTANANQEFAVLPDQAPKTIKDTETQVATYSVTEHEAATLSIRWTWNFVLGK